MLKGLTITYQVSTNDRILQWIWENPRHVLYQYYWILCAKWKMKSTNLSHWFIWRTVNKNKKAKKKEAYHRKIVITNSNNSDKKDESDVMNLLN